MKKLTLLLSAMLLACATNLWADVATLTFTAACSGSGTDDKANAWTVTSDAAESAYDGTKGIHYGTSSVAVSHLTLTNSTIAGTITKIVVNASGASKTSAKLDVTVGGATFGSQQSLTSTAKNYTFEGSAKGEIVVKLSQTSAKKALYVKSIAVTYSTAALTSIEIVGEPTKTTYMAGDAFSTEGLKVMGTYEGDDTPKEITTGITWEVTPTTLTAGLTSVEVKATVDDKSTTRTINSLTVTAPKTLTSIAVSGTPAEFWKGDTFNHDGMTVIATWDDASTTDVTAEAEFSTPDMATAGTQTVTVTYKEKTATYDITVKTIANTQETAYTVADAIALIDAGKDLSTEVFVKGIVSEIHTPWSDQFSNITYNISDDGTTDSDQFQLYRCKTNGANAGDTVIAKGAMKKYNTTYEFDAGNTIVAIAEKVVTSIAISGEASKTNYYAGQTFNPEGLVVTATYEDKTTADVTELVDWTFAPAVLEEGTTTVSVTATYKELNAAPKAITVTVGPAPKIVTIDLTKDETSTATADKLEWKGTVLTVTATKGTDTNADNYYPGTPDKSYTSTRFYKGATLTFTPADGITLISITYTATSESYTSAMANSTWTNASTSISGQTVTITPTDGTQAISAALGGTTGGTSFVINYAGETTPTIVTNASFEPQSIKTIENGQLIILRDGKKYNAMGVQL